MPKTSARPSRSPVKPAPTGDLASLAGMSDATIEARTGRTWEQWVSRLDRKKAHEWEHKTIADHIHAADGLNGWWSQTVAVGYERIKGLRDKRQRRGGSYEAHKSKTVNVPVAALYAAWADPKQRKAWLPVGKLVIRAAQEDRSLRITWPDGTSVECWFVAKGPAKASVAVTQAKLPDAEAVEERKAWWGERLEVLKGKLEGK